MTRTRAAAIARRIGDRASDRLFAVTGVERAVFVICDAGAWLNDARERHTQGG